MSQTEYRTLDVRDHEEANRRDAVQDPTEMALSWEPGSKYTDSSEPLFNMYSNLTKHHNKRIDVGVHSVNNYILITTLFSTVIAALLSLTVQDLKPSPQAAAAFYLENMYKLQLLTNTNNSHSFTPTRSSEPSVPRHAIWVNILLLMSLCINISLAFMVLWIRGRIPIYLWATESPQLPPHYRARIHVILSSEFFASRTFLLMQLTLWLSPVFFFSGLFLYLFNVNRVVFGPVLGSLCYCIIVLFFVIRWVVMPRSRSKSSARVDDRILDRLFEAVVKDSDLVQFFENLVDFCRSKVVDNPLDRIIDFGKRKVHKSTVKQFLERTRSSKSLLDSEKMRRLVAFVNFADTVRLPDVASPILEDVSHWDLRNALQYVDMDQFVKGQGHRSQEKVGLCAQSIIAYILSNVERRDEHWVALAADQLGESKEVIQSYLNRGIENVLLANLTHITRQIFHSSKTNRKVAKLSASLLRLLPNFDVRNSAPELQNSFVALWNEIEQAPNDFVRTKIHDTLLNLRNALTTPPASHASLPGRPSDLISPVREEVEENAQMSTITGTSLPVSHQGASSAISPSPFNLPASGDITADAADELSLCSISEAARRPIPALPSHGYSDTSQDVTSVDAGNIANTQSGEQPPVRPDSSSVLPAMVTSTPTSTNPEEASVFRPYVASTAPIISRHDAQDRGGPIELTSLHQTRQSDTSARDLDPSDSPI